MLNYTMLVGNSSLHKQVSWMVSLEWLDLLYPIVVLFNICFKAFWLFWAMTNCGRVQLRPLHLMIAGM